MVTSNISLVTSGRNLSAKQNTKVKPVKCLLNVIRFATIK